MDPMKELWTGLFELLTPPTEFGDTGCFTNVVAWADDADDFRAKVSKILEKYSWFVVSVENCVTVACVENPTDELAGQIETAQTRPDDCVHGTLHYFPSKPV
ncbi:MAG TPA: hypothetical protein VGR47_15870 [Terracidiphilus sp.]|nr:hypothetical protein [Terracidiphilus sp.]